MKCAQFKNLLEDYLDKELSAADAGRVKEHLSNCPDCTREIEFLKKYKKYAATLKKVKAPENLLANIHKRIEGSTGMSGLIKKIFFPLKFKLPMEVAGICALALIAFFVFYPRGPEKHEYESSAPQYEATRDESSVSPRLRSTKTPPGLAEARRADKKEAPPIEHRVASGVSDGTAQRENEYRATAPEESNIRPKTGEISLYLSQAAPKEKASETQASERAKIVESDEKAGGRIEYSEDRTLKDKKADSGKTFTSRKQAPPHASVDDILRSVDGRVIERTYDNKSKYRERIIAEIPAAHLGAFIEKLSFEWHIRQQTPKKLPADITRIKIYLIFER